MGIGILELLTLLALLVGAALALAFGVFWVRAQFLSAQQQGRVPCPHCAELIQPAARICRFCQREVGDLLETERRPRSLFQ